MSTKDKLIRELMGAGLTEIQARRLSDSFIDMAAETKTSVPTNLATREDVKDLEIRILREMGGLRDKIDDVRKFHSWTVGGATVFLSLLMTLFRFYH